MQPQAFVNAERLSLGAKKLKNRHVFAVPDGAANWL
jgi:hypothetical protein